MLNDDTYWGISEAAKFLRVSVSTIYSWVFARKIPFRKHGSKLAFSRHDLANWSDQTKVSPLDRVGCPPKDFCATKSMTKSRSLKTEQNTRRKPSPNQEK
jgi:excisionase family DNA binding protein